MSHWKGAHLQTPSQLTGSRERKRERGVGKDRSEGGRGGTGRGGGKGEKGETR